MCAGTSCAYNHPSSLRAFSCYLPNRLWMRQTRDSRGVSAACMHATTTTHASSSSSSGMQNACCPSPVERKNLGWPLKRSLLYVALLPAHVLCQMRSPFMLLPIKGSVRVESVLPARVTFWPLVVGMCVYVRTILRSLFLFFLEGLEEGRRKLKKVGAG